MIKLRSITLLVSLLAFSGAIFADDQLDGVSKSLFKVQLELAKEGSAQGQFYVGEMYEQGLGTPKDINKAKEWFRKSAAQGFTAASTKLKQIERNKLRALEDKERAKQIEQAKARRNALKKKLEANQKKQATVTRKKKPKPASKPAPVKKAGTKKAEPKNGEGFTADPCKGPKAKFMSMCK